VVFVSSFLVQIERQAGMRAFLSTHRTLVPTRFTLEQPRLFSWLGSPSRYMLVWGWMPQWYVLAGLAPATRESHTYGQMVASPLREYFRSRFIRDLSASQPDIVIDATTGRTSFLFNRFTNDGPETFDFLHGYLGDHFERLPSLAENECQTTYVRKNLMESVRGMMIAPVAVSASGHRHPVFGPVNLFDNSFTEDACVDYWLLPEGAKGSVQVTFGADEVVESVWLLNTRNGVNADHASQAVRVTLLDSDGQAVESVTLDMAPSPQWTRTIFRSDRRARELKLEVLSFKGIGGGLNEIKIFRRVRHAAD
jgi:hypothetical protein